MQFPILIEKDKDGYYATCPSLADCSTQGNTYKEALTNIKDAIKIYVQDCLQDNETITTNKVVSLQVVDIPVREK